MSAMLLPDDPHTADQIVRLMQDKFAALQMLRRMREERDQWRDAYYRVTSERPSWITDGGKVTLTEFAP